MATNLIDLTTVIATLIHELGHQVKVKDHSALNTLGLKVATIGVQYAKREDKEVSRLLREKRALTPTETQALVRDFQPELLPFTSTTVPKDQARPVKRKRLCGFYFPQSDEKLSQKNAAAYFAAASGKLYRMMPVREVQKRINRIMNGERVNREEHQLTESQVPSYGCIEYLGPQKKETKELDGSLSDVPIVALLNLWRSGHQNKFFNAARNSAHWLIGSITEANNGLMLLKMKRKNRNTQVEHTHRVYLHFYGNTIRKRAELATRLYGEPELKVWIFSYDPYPFNRPPISVPTLKASTFMIALDDELE